MLPLASLWLPIAVSTAAVFVFSALVWMAGPHHRNEVRSLPAERATAMGRAMTLTALWYLAVNVVIGIIAAKTMGTLTPAGDVFRVTALTALLAHAAADGPNAIWWGKPWRNVLKHGADSVLYALATGATFMWFWPE